MVPISLKVFDSVGLRQEYWARFADDTYSAHKLKLGGYGCPRSDAVVVTRLKTEYHASLSKRRHFVKFQQEEDRILFLLRWS